jgi:heme-degrading monooxygenase HmoA
MYTRLLTFTGATGIDAGVDYLSEKALPILEGQHGFRGVSASADRAENSMSILSLWESEADRSASDSALGKAREESLKLVGGELEIENFEEVVRVITKPPQVGSVLNVVRVRMEPESIEANIAWFKESIVPTITSQRGFCALRNMVDRPSGRALSGSVFEDKDSADASLAGIPDRRSAAEERGVTFESISQREILFSRMI